MIENCIALKIHKIHFKFIKTQLCSLYCVEMYFFCLLCLDGISYVILCFFCVFLETFGDFSNCLCIFAVWHENYYVLELFCKITKIQ